MFTQKRTNLEKALISTVVTLLLLTTAGLSEVLTERSLTSEAPPATNSSLTMRSTTEEPEFHQSHRRCNRNHSEYCLNGGVCIHPQDNDRPFCNCKEPYGGMRCEFYSVKTYTLNNMEPMIGIIFGAFMVVVFLAILIYCFAYKRCVNSTPLIKPAPSEITV